MSEMATAFCMEDLCEEEGCQRPSQLFYSVRERRRLCRGCAYKKRTGSIYSADTKWTCKKHGELIKFFCVQHNVVICQSCATVSHQKPCDLKDVDDVIKENRKKLKGTLPIAKDRVAVLKNRMKTIHKTSKDIQDHFDSVERQIRSNIDDKKEMERKKARDRNLVIREEAESKIQCILKERDEQLKLNLEELEVREKKADERGAILSADLQVIKGTVEKAIGEITEKSKEVLRKLDESLQGIERALLSDQDLCIRTRSLLAAVNEASQSDKGVDTLQRIATTANEVRYFNRRSTEAGPSDRIDGFRGEWALKDTADIPESIALAGVVGCIDEGSVVILDKQSGDLYLTELKTKAIEKIVEGTVDTVVSCAVLGDKIRVCGKVKKGAFSECIDLYGADWQPIKPPEKADNEEHVDGTKRVFVDSDSTGMILAADLMASEIKIISPSDLIIRNFEESNIQAVPVQDFYTEGFRCLSSGDIVVKSGYGGLTVIDRSGNIRNFIQDRKWGRCPEFSIDSMTDTIYVVYKDTKRMVYAVDQVCPQSSKVFRKIVEYPLPNNRRNISAHTCAVTPSGILVTFNGDKLFFYKKSFTLNN